MENILKRIDSAIAEEKEAAYTNYGRINNRHEGYGVLMEEVLEAREEFHEMVFQHSDLIGVVDDPEAWTERIDRIKTRARFAAAELIQVASVCDRILEAEEDGEPCEACKVEL